MAFLPPDDPEWERLLLSGESPICEWKASFFDWQVRACPRWPRPGKGLIDDASFQVLRAAHSLANSAGGVVFIGAVEPKVLPKDLQRLETCSRGPVQCVGATRSCTAPARELGIEVGVGGSPVRLRGIEEEVAAVSRDRDEWLRKAQDVLSLANVGFNVQSSEWREHQWTPSTTHYRVLQLWDPPGVPEVHWCSVRGVTIGAVVVRPGAHPLVVEKRTDREVSLGVFVREASGGGRTQFRPLAEIQRTELPSLTSALKSALPAEVSLPTVGDLRRLDLETLEKRLDALALAHSQHFRMLIAEIARDCRVPDPVPGDRSHRRELLRRWLSGGG